MCRQTMTTPSDDSTLLPEWFLPSEKDVICGWARQNHHHAGNKLFRELIDKYAPHYVVANSKLEKTQVIAAVIDEVRSESPNGGFVKKDFYSGRWYEIGNEKARDKVGHAIRKAAEELSQKQKGYSPKQQSSNLSKQAIHKAQAKKQRNESTSQARKQESSKPSDRLVPPTAPPGASQQLTSASLNGPAVAAAAATAPSASAAAATATAPQSLLNRSALPNVGHLYPGDLLRPAFTNLNALHPTSYLRMADGQIMPTSALAGGPAAASVSATFGNQLSHIYLSNMEALAAMERSRLGTLRDMSADLLAASGGGATSASSGAAAGARAGLGTLGGAMAGGMVSAPATTFQGILPAAAIVTTTGLPQQNPLAGIFPGADNPLSHSLSAFPRATLPATLANQNAAARLEALSQAIAASPANHLGLLGWSIGNPSVVGSTASTQGGHSPTSTPELPTSASPLPEESKSASVGSPVVQASREHSDGDSSSGQRLVR